MKCGEASKARGVECVCSPWEVDRGSLRGVGWGATLLGHIGQMGRSVEGTTDSDAVRMAWREQEVELKCFQEAAPINEADKVGTGDGGVDGEERLLGCCGGRVGVVWKFII